MKRGITNFRFSFSPEIPALVLFIFLCNSCVSSVVKAEEYYALGTAYFELQKYAEAKTWFNKAKFHRATKTASEYNLGCVAYETGRYGDAKEYFERIIARDGENITALKAAAYTCIKLEEYREAEEYYRRVLELVPESYDEGYNYALVLMAMGRAEDAERVLEKYSTENPRALLILARAQKLQGKPEAADAYTASLFMEDDSSVRAEYAAYLAGAGFKAKALEEYRKALQNGKLTEEKKEAIMKAMEELETDGKGSAETKH